MSEIFTGAVLGWPAIKSRITQMRLHSVEEHQLFEPQRMTAHKSAE
jgi:hypothetical protein